MSIVRSAVYRTAVTVGLAATAATPAWAHDTWILPIKAAVAVGETATFEATSAMHFPEPEIPVSADRLVAARLRIGRALNALEVVSSTPKSFASRLPPRPPGPRRPGWNRGRARLT